MQDEFFKRCNDSKTVKCQLCEVKLTYTEGTTNMLNHIRLKYSVQDESAWWKDNSDKYSKLSVLISNINYVLSGKFIHYFHKKKFSE
jgi:hypothetical protein